MSKHMLAVGRVVRGGTVIITTAPTLEAQLDAAIERSEARVAANAALLDELGYMNAVLNEMQAGTRPVGLHLSDADLEACENEILGEGLVGLW